jgi:hypothetical protein
MHQEHHDPNDEQDVNEPRGNVKREETKQPKNNQNRSDKSKHCLHLLVYARQSEVLLAAHGTDAVFSLASCFWG